MEVLEYCRESTRVLPREYSSTFSEVLELVVPVEIMLVVVEDHLFCDAGFFQCFEDEFLLFWGKGAVASSTLKVGVAAPMADADGLEPVVLVGVHLSLEVGESSGVDDGRVVAIVGAVRCSGATRGVDELKIFIAFHLFGIGDLMETVGCHGAVCMSAHGIVGGKIGVFFFWHDSVSFFCVTFWWI